MLESKIVPEIDWSKFQFYTWIPMEVRIQSIKDENWQIVRKSMLKTSLEFKFVTLQNWLKKNKFSKKSKVQTQHYTQALRRSGLIE